jgi:hypothetical protein
LIVEAEINGSAGLVAKADQRTLITIRIDTDGFRITAIFGVASSDKLEVIPPAV